MSLTKSQMHRALRGVPVALRRQWNAGHGGCPTCQRDEDRAKCAIAVHFQGERLESVYQDLVVARVSSGPAPIPADVAALLRRLDALEAREPRVTEIRIADKPAVRLEKGEFAHAALPDVLLAAQARLPVMMVGPTGSGKSRLAWTVAKALNRPLYFNAVSGGISEGVILGRLLPTGENARMEYATSQFVTAYEQGGVYLADEFDAIDPNVALIFNDALANDHAPVPHRIDKPVAKRHKDFVFLAAANTFGTGADRQYVGRSQLDAATLSRFDVTTIEVGYDDALEASLIPAEILAWVRGVRKVIGEHRLRRTCSTRTGVNAARLENVGEKRKNWVNRYFAPWTREEQAKVPAPLRAGEAW